MHCLFSNGMESLKLYWLYILPMNTSIMHKCPGWDLLPLVPEVLSPQTELSLEVATMSQLVVAALWFNSV